MNVTVATARYKLNHMLYYHSSLGLLSQNIIQCISNNFTLYCGQFLVFTQLYYSFVGRVIVTCNNVYNNMSVFVVNEDTDMDLVSEIEIN